MNVRVAYISTTNGDIFGLFLAVVLFFVFPIVLKTVSGQFQILDTWCVSGFGLHQSEFLFYAVYISPCLNVHVCECVQGWLPSLCLAFVAWARALRLPRGHHCPRSPQPSGHRCSPIDTMLLTRTPHLSRCVGGQARRPVACHAIGHLQAPRDAGRGNPSRLQF